MAIYARVSTGEQTPELQLRELRDYAGHRKRRQSLRAISLRSGADAASLTRVALIEFRGDGGASHDQSRDEGAKESFAPAPGVVHELEEAEIQRQLLLRDTPVWPQPGA